MQEICYITMYNLTYRIQNKGSATGFFGLDSQNQKSFLITNDHVFDDDSPILPCNINIKFQHCKTPLTGDQLFNAWMSKDGVYRQAQVCCVMLQ